MPADHVLLPVEAHTGLLHRTQLGSAALRGRSAVRSPGRILLLSAARRLLAALRGSVLCYRAHDVRGALLLSDGSSRRLLVEAATCPSLRNAHSCAHSSPGPCWEAHTELPLPPARAAARCRLHTARRPTQPRLPLALDQVEVGGPQLRAQPGSWTVLGSSHRAPSAASSCCGSTQLSTWLSSSPVAHPGPDAWPCGSRRYVVDHVLLYGMPRLLAHNLLKSIRPMGRTREIQGSAGAMAHSMYSMCKEPP
jgi:hypothetical protein